MAQRALGYLLRELRIKNCKDLSDRDLLERFCTARLVLMLLVATTAGVAVGRFATAEPAEAQAKAVQTQTGQAPAAGKPGNLNQPQVRRTDLYGDRLPPDAIARLGTERYRAPYGMAFDTEGKVYLSAINNAVLLHDLRTGKVVRSFAMPASLTPREARPPERIYAVALSADGKTAAAAGFDVVAVWNAETGEQLRHLNVDRGSFGQVLLFAPDGKKLARDSGAGRTCLWDLTTGKLLWKRGRVDRDSVAFVPQVFLPDGRTLIGTEKDSVVLVEAATGRELRRFACRASHSTLVFSRDRRILAAPVQDWVLQLWDVTTGEKLRAFPGLRSTGEHFAFSPDGKTLAWSTEDQEIRLMDVATGKELRRVAKGLGTASRLTFFRDNNLLAFCLWNEETVRVWDLERDREVYPIGGNRGCVYAAIYSPDGQTVFSAAMDNTIRAWDLASSKELYRTEAHSGGVCCLAMTADGETLASASLNDKAVRLWNTATREETTRLPLKEGAHALLFSPDGSELLTASQVAYTPGEVRDYVLRLWNVKARKELRRWNSHSAHCPMALSPDGRFVASEHAGSILVWDVGTGRQYRELPLPAPVSVNDLTFSPDGTTLVSAQRDGRAKNPQSAVRFWELATGKERLSVTSVPAWGKCLAFSPNGNCLAVGGADDGVHVFDAFTGEAVRHFQGHHAALSTLAFAPHGKSLASGSADTTILIWKMDERPRKHISNISSGEVDALWRDLAGADAAKAYRAIGIMAAAPKTIAFLARHLKPVAPADPTKLKQLITELDSQSFTVRNKASEELAKIGELAEPALRKALSNQPALELRRRLEMFLRKLEQPVTSPDLLRSLRALEVLERLGIPEANALLRALASGAPESRITQRAQTALLRNIK